MSYTENLKTSMEEYETLHNALEEKTSSEKYATAISLAPFEFISAIHICELLEAFNSDTPSTMQFDSAQDAEATYTKIIGFRDKKGEVLELADAIVEAGKDADKINQLVESSPHLPNSMLVAKDETNYQFAVAAIKMGSRYNELLSRKFRDRFTESCIENLSSNDLDFLVSKGIIREQHIDNAPRTGSKAYMEKYRRLCIDVFGKEDVSLGRYQQSLKGVTFDNPDGENRQDILKQIDEEMKAGRPVELSTMIEEYTPELGEPEPSVRITWGHKTIGFLPKESARQISGMGSQPIRLETKLSRITGGDRVTYGAVVEVEVREMIKVEPSMEAPPAAISR